MYTYIILLAVTFAIIGGLSHFHQRDSTLAQRGWIIAWLVADSFRAYFFGWYLVLLPWKKLTAIGHLRGLKTLPHIERVLFVLIYGAPAIGAAALVGQMLEAYGSCTKIY
jgi:hypothetical protein